MTTRRTCGAPYGVPLALLLSLSLSTGCIEFVRVPLVVPLAPVGGSRPAGPQGIHLGGEFGDGVWGQEQERAEMAGGVIGWSQRDRFEVSGTAHNSTRTVRDEEGAEHRGVATSGVRGKVRLGDFHDGRASVAVQVGIMNAARESGEEQHESLSALDLAVQAASAARSVVATQVA